MKLINVFKLIADLKVTFGYSYNEIMYEIPFSNLVMQLNSYYKGKNEVKPVNNPKKGDSGLFSQL